MDARSIELSSPLPNRETAIPFIPYIVLPMVVIALMYASERVEARAPAAATGSSSEVTAGVRHGVRPVLMSNLLFWSAVAIMIVFSASRRDVGTDYPLYSGLLEQLDPNLPWLTQIQTAAQDPGFVLLSLISLSITDSPVLLMTASAILTIVPISLALRHSRVSLPAAFALFFFSSLYLFPLNLVRQGIAVALSFYAWKYLDHHRTRFWLLNLLAASFHLSALLIALVQYLARNIRPSVRFYGIIGGASVALVAVMFLPLEHLFGDFGARYGQYIVEARANLAAIGLGTLANLVVRIVVAAYTGTAPARDRLADRWQVFTVLSIPFMAVGVLLPVAARLELYFLPALVLLLADTLRRRRAGRAQWAIIGVAALGYYLVTLWSFYGLLPYDSFLFG